MQISPTNTEVLSVNIKPPISIIKIGELHSFPWSIQWFVLDCHNEGTKLNIWYRNDKAREALIHNLFVGVGSTTAGTQYDGNGFFMPGGVSRGRTLACKP